MAKNEGSGSGSRLQRFLIGQRPSRTLVRALVAALVAYGFFGHVFRPVLVRGRSMEPTIRDGTLRMANLMAFRLREPQRGDIVVIRMAGPRLLLLKRVLAVPSDRIQFSRGEFWLNGMPFEEPYVEHRGSWSTAEYTLGPHEYYVAGDNRESPIEEHATGITDRRNILGGLLY